MNSVDQNNPYAAPTPGAEDGGAKRGFAIADEVRQLIATTGTLMIVASIIQLLSGMLTLFNEGVSKQSVVTIALFGIVPAFTAIAGFSLRNLGKPGDDLGSLMSGMRQLHVAYMVKGIVLLTVVGLMLLAFAAMFLGVGAGLFGVFD